MLVAVDIGNTNIVLGFIKGEEITDTYRISTLVPHTADEYGLLLMQFLVLAGYKQNDVEGVIICSVVPQIMHSFRASIINLLHMRPLVVGPGLKTGVNVRIDDPKTMGADCIADCVAAYYLHGGASLVIDMGTATTFNYIDEDAVIRMGVITAGIQTSARALAGGTAQLPEVEIARPTSVMATNTPAAIQTGLYYSALGGIEKMISVCREEIGRPFRVVMTGGFARIIADDCAMIDVYDPDLIFHGMRLIYERNRKKTTR